MNAHHSGKVCVKPGSRPRPHQPSQPAAPANSGTWQIPTTSWSDIKRRFSLSDDRYEDFKFLLYLDINDKFVQNYTNYQLDIEEPIIIGRLSNHLDFWKTLSGNDWLLDIIKNGFKVPFLRKPPKILLPNNKSALTKENVPWVLSKITEFEKSGFIERVDSPPHCVLPLQVKDGVSKKSLIHDESPLNIYVEKSSFKIEGWETMFEYAVDSNYGIKYDLKKYYFHIQINKNYRKYFGFSFIIEGKTVYYRWLVLPFGYTLGPLIARHIMKPLVTHWRLLNIKNCCFFDDGLALDSSFEFLQKASLQIHCDLIRAGLIPGIEKCSWIPTPTIEWIGFEWNLKTKSLSIKNERVIIFKTLLKKFIVLWPNVTFRDISKITGILNSMYPVLIGTEQLFARNLQTFVNIRHFHDYNWDDKIHTDQQNLFTQCIKELEFWLENFDSLNYRNFTPKVPTMLGWVDASAFATGGVVLKVKRPYLEKLYSIDGLLVIPDNSADIRHVDLVYRALNISVNNRDRFSDFVVHHKMLDKYEREYDSNERELIGGLHLIKSNLDFLRDSCFTLHFDNTNASKILIKGSTKPRLHQYAIDIRKLCFDYNITLYTQSIPRSINETADLLSKFYDREDYTCSDQFYYFLQKEFDIKCNYDRFASNLNSKCFRFNSLTSCIGTSGVDCFQYPWGSPFINWLFPPPRLVLRCINHLKESSGIGLLLVPEWKTSDYYPVLMTLENKYKKCLRFSGKNIFNIGSDPTSYFSTDFSSAVNVWLLNFDI